MVIIERDRRYAPDDILKICTTTSQKSTSSIEKKQLYEAEVVAGMLKAMEKAPECLGDYIQIVNPAVEYTPDIRVLSVNPSGKNIPVEDVEVVSFTNHSKREGILAFFLRTKLSPVYAYPKETVILCHVDMQVKDQINMAQRVSDNLQNMPQVKHRMYLLFGDPQTHNCTLAQVFPELVYFESK